MSGLRLLSAAEAAGLSPRMREVVEYRKSGLSLNHVAGCPLECAYCIRHEYGNWDMKIPRLLMRDEDAVRALLEHPFFAAHRTPLQVFNRATDPMLPSVRPHTLNVARLLDARGLTNHLLIITRWRVDEQVCEALNALRHLRVTLLVTHSNIGDRRIEPVDSAIARQSLHTAYRRARQYRVVLYWRPIVPGLNDRTEDLELAVQLSRSAHATVFTGLFYREQIRAYYRDAGVPEPYPDVARRKIMPGELEARILEHFAAHAPEVALFRKTSCGVSHAHGLPDYNGHYAIQELCDICPARQVGLCASAFTRPDKPTVAAAAAQMGATTLPRITDRAVVTVGLEEQRRYWMQHRLGFQVHDAGLPHHEHRHGRADTGWTTVPRQNPGQDPGQEQP